LIIITRENQNKRDANMISKIILKLFSILLIFLTGLLNSIFDDKPRNNQHYPENKIESVKQENKVSTVADVTIMAGVSAVVRGTAVGGVSTPHHKYHAVAGAPSCHGEQTSSRLNAVGMKYLLNAIGMPYL
jgi:hypothetical protein